MLFTSNPFAALSASLSPAVMQTYVVVMIVLVLAGTLFDVVHKGSATYFFQNWRKSKGKVPRQLGGGELMSIAIQDDENWHCFTLSRYDRHSGKWNMEKAPVYHIID